MYFFLDKKEPKSAGGGQEPSEGPLPHKAHPGWHQFRLSLRLSCPALLTHMSALLNSNKVTYAQAFAPDALPGCQAAR
jgi:hypothetical protein